MKRTLKKIMILLAVFIVALAVYFAVSLMGNEEDSTAYTAIEDANLPVVYMEIFGRKMNSLNGYVTDNYKTAGRVDLTILPEDRRLGVSFEEVNSGVNGIQYEVRSMEDDRLVERTVMEDWTQDGTEVKTVLPIQNLLTTGEEYLLKLAISTEQQPVVYYYTRIVWAQDHHAEEMLNLASDFSARTFNYESARELTTYLETDANADNNSLGRVTLKNNFDQLTWRNMGLEQVSGISVHLKELQGVMGNIELAYVVKRTAADGNEIFYDVSENFTMKWSPQRIYMMDYDRHMNQIFSGDAGDYSDKRIMLGISDSDELQAVSDPGNKYKAFVANRELWVYDTDRGNSTKVFAFRKNEDDLKTGYNSHGVKILSVTEEGGIDFLVYGYMSRGNHEGTTGVAFYRYESGDNTLTERLYLAADEDYWRLREDINKLSYVSSNQSLYILMNHAVYRVNLQSKEYVTIAEGLTEENFAVSYDGSRIAWQDGEDPYGSEKLHVMELESGKLDEIGFQEQTVLRLIGFVGSDLVYGLARPGEKLTADGRVIGLPLYAIEIVGISMEIEARYEKTDVYLTDVEIRNSRVHMMRMRKTSEVYEKTEEDTLVCNEEVELDPLAGIGYLADNEQGRVYFVQMGEGNAARNSRIHVPEHAVAEDNNVLSLRPEKALERRFYYAYSGGRMRGSYVDFPQAVMAAHDGMGIVTDEMGRVYWNRVDRSDIRTIRDYTDEIASIQRYLGELAQGLVTSSDGTELIDARGLSLSQVLYFVSQGKPVAAYIGNGSYGLIYGYDSYNISILWYPGTEFSYTEKMGLNDAAAFFAQNGENDFVCFMD